MRISERRRVAAAEETLTRVQALWAQLADEGRL